MDLEEHKGNQNPRLRVLRGGVQVTLKSKSAKPVTAPPSGALWARTTVALNS